MFILHTKVQICNLAKWVFADSIILQPICSSCDQPKHCETFRAKQIVAEFYFAILLCQLKRNIKHIRSSLLCKQFCWWQTGSTWKGRDVSKLRKRNAACGYWYEKIKTEPGTLILIIFRHNGMFFFKTDFETSQDNVKLMRKMWQPQVLDMIISSLIYYILCLLWWNVV